MHDETLCSCAIRRFYVLYDVLYVGIICRNELGVYGGRVMYI